MSDRLLRVPDLDRRLQGLLGRLQGLLDQWLQGLPIQRLQGLPDQRLQGPLEQQLQGLLLSQQHLPHQGLSNHLFPVSVRW